MRELSAAMLAAALDQSLGLVRGPTSCHKGMRGTILIVLNLTEQSYRNWQPTGRWTEVPWLLSMVASPISLMVLPFKKKSILEPLLEGETLQVILEGACTLAFALVGNPDSANIEGVMFRSPPAIHRPPPRDWRCLGL